MNTKDVSELIGLYKNLSPLARFHMYIRLKRAYFDKIERFVVKKGHILDFGCGHGFFSLYLAKKSKARTITAIDIAKNKIAIAKKSTHTLQVSFHQVQKTESFLTHSSSFDSIVIVNVLYLLPQKKQEALVAKAAKALKPGGKLLIVEHNAAKRFKTLYTKVREFLMVKVLRFTHGETLTFNTHLWWMKLLKGHFTNTAYKKLDPWGLQILYIATK